MKHRLPFALWRGDSKRDSGALLLAALFALLAVSPAWSRNAPSASPALPPHVMLWWLSENAVEAEAASVASLPLMQQLSSDGAGQIETPQWAATDAHLASLGAALPPTQHAAPRHKAPRFARVLSLHEAAQVSGIRTNRRLE